MLIESLIRRNGGSTVTLGTKPNVRIYKFQANPTATPPDPRHTANVTNEDDISTLLAIKEGYRVAKTATAAPAANAAKTATGAANTAPVLTVGQVGGKGPWFVISNGKPVGSGYGKKSDADAALAAAEKTDGE